jgi:hypothetical protein
VIVPLYVPAARPAGVVVTVRLALPVPDVGVTESHVPPPLVLAVAVKACDPLTCTVWAAGEAPPWTYANCERAGSDQEPGAGDTQGDWHLGDDTRGSGSKQNGALIGPGSQAGWIRGHRQRAWRCSWRCRWPARPSARSSPVAVVALVVKLVDPLAVSWRVWVTAEPPAAALRVSDVGLATIAVPPVTWSTTGTVTGTPPAATGVKKMSVRYMPAGRLTGFKVRLTLTGVVRLTLVLVTCNQDACVADMVNSCCGRLLRSRSDTGPPARGCR